jgi:hypothetical protein
MYPVLLISLGIVVLLLGKRVAVLGAAVGAIVGVALLYLFSASGSLVWQLVLVGGLAIAGFFLAGLAKGLVNIVLVVLCALAGAAIMVTFLDLFNVEAGWVNWVLAIVGGLIGWMMYSRFNDMALVILSAIIGGLLVTRGLANLLPAFQGWLGTLVTLVLAGGGIGFQSGYFANRKAAQAQAAAPAAPAAASDEGSPTAPTSNG